MQQDLSKMNVPNGGRLRHLCRKTVLCRFFQKGACKRGSACIFAHDEQDMRTKPDLQRTKPCPTVANGQRCEDTNCPFAHFAGELRKFKPQPHVLDSEAAAPTKKGSRRVLRVENFSSNSSTISSTGSSGGQASSDISNCTTRAGSKESACSGEGRHPEQAQPKSAKKDAHLAAGPAIKLMPFALPQFWPPPPSCPSITLDGLSSSSEYETWASPVEFEVHPEQPTSHQSYAEEAEEEKEEERQLLVVNTFLTLVLSSRPSDHQRSSSTPPGQ